MGELRPILDLSGLGAVDRQRSLGLAYAEWAVQQKDAAQVPAYRARAAELLAGVRAAGLRDPAVDVMLVRLGSGIELIRPYIDGPGSPDLTPQDRSPPCPFTRTPVRGRGASPRRCQLCGNSSACAASRTIGNSSCTVNSPSGTCRKPWRRLQSAATIDPRLERAHELLAPYYRQRGDLQRATWHQRRALRVAP